MNKKQLYENIMTSVAKEVKKTLNEMSASQQNIAETKMDAWHNGTRKQNVRACSDEKLKNYLQICINKGYDYEASILQSEIKSRIESRKDDIYIIVSWRLDILSYIKYVLDNAIELLSEEIITNPSEYIKQYRNNSETKFFQLAPGTLISDHEDSIIENRSHGNGALYPALRDGNKFFVFDHGDFNHEGRGVEWFNSNDDDWMQVINIIEKLEQSGKNVHLFAVTDD